MTDKIDFAALRYFPKLSNQGDRLFDDELPEPDVGGERGPVVIAMLIAAVAGALVGGGAVWLGLSVFGRDAGIIW